MTFGMDVETGDYPSSVPFVFQSISGLALWGIIRRTIEANWVSGQFHHTSVILVTKEEGLRLSKGSFVPEADTHTLALLNRVYIIVNLGL